MGKASQGYLLPSTMRAQVLTFNLASTIYLRKMGSETESKVVHSESKNACDGSTDLHILRCGHQILAGLGLDTDFASSVTKCGIRGQERQILCTMCLHNVFAQACCIQQRQIRGRSITDQRMRGLLKLLKTPLGRALREIRPDLKSYQPARTVGATGFVNPLLKPSMSLAAFEETPGKAAAKVGGNVIEKPVNIQGETAEPGNKPQQTLFVEQPGQEDVLAYTFYNIHNSEMDLLGSQSLVMCVMVACSSPLTGQDSSELRGCLNINIARLPEDRFLRACLLPRTTRRR